MIAKAFEKGPAFIGYLTAGDGGLKYSLEAALALEAGGVDLLEIGIPFSDPVADGEAIQKAMIRARSEGMTPEGVLTLVKEIRKRSSIPIVLMSYYNPIFSQGENYLKSAKDSGADGLLIVDLPLEEMPQNTFGLEKIFLVTPSTSMERMAKIAKNAEGFIYYVCQKGTTGVRDRMPEGFQQQIALLKKVARHPIAVGFGISNRTSAQSVLEVADGFVIGSLFVDAMGKKMLPEELSQLAKSVDPRGMS